jgi:hypothetical protein
MELILAIVLAGPLGRFARSAKLGLGLYLLAWALVLPIQTAIVHSENADDINRQYPVVNAVILAGGVALNRRGALARQRRRQHGPARDTR